MNAQNFKNGQTVKTQYGPTYCFIENGKKYIQYKNRFGFETSLQVTNMFFNEILETR